MILLKNGTYIDWKALEFRSGDIIVEEGSDGSIQFPGQAKTHQPDLQIIDCTGKYITKSFANGHHHAYSALACGMPSPAKAPANFPEILSNIWWKLDKALDPEIIRSSALVTAMACARNGVTFAIDHHASPGSVGGNLEIIAQAFDEVGVGHLLCYEISDRDGKEITDSGLQETEAYLSYRQGLVGIHASFTVSDDTLNKAVELTRLTKSGVHIHAAEDQLDQDQCLSKYGIRVIERLSDHGVLDFPKTILAHCLHLNENERRLVDQSPAWIVQNMESNLNNGVGLFISRGLGKNIMLGTDGMHSDMLRSAKATFIAGRSSNPADGREIYQRFRNVHYYLQSNGFEGDGPNNLVVLDYDPPTPLTAENFPGHFLFGIEAKHISHVISQGRLIMEEGHLLTVNENQILRESRKQAARLWERMQ